MKPIYLYSTVLILSLLMVVFVNLDIAYADGPKQERYGPRFMEQLNDAQKAEMDSLITGMKANGATREEIHAAVKDKLDGFAVKLPPREGWNGGRGFHAPWFRDQLNEEQQKVVREKVESMREDGASRKEIHDAVTKMLKDYGVEPPEGGFRGPRQERGFGMRFPGMDLNDEQREAIRDKAEAMREDGASREEIHETVTKMLKDYGVEPPEDFQQHWALMKELNNDQRKEVRETVRHMHENGASRAEIKKTVDALLDKYGVEKPEPGK